MGSPYVDNFIQQYTYFHPLLYPFHGYVCHTGLKGTQNQFSSWSENTEMCKYFHLPASFTCSIGNYTKEVLSSLPVIAPRGAVILVRSLPVKNSKTLARDVIDTLATHASLLPDVADIDCWA